MLNATVRMNRLIESERNRLTSPKSNPKGFAYWLGISRDVQTRSILEYLTGYRITPRKVS